MAREPIGVLHNMKRHREKSGILKTVHRHEISALSRGQLS